MIKITGIKSLHLMVKENLYEFRLDINKQVKMLPKKLVFPFHKAILIPKEIPTSKTILNSKLHYFNMIPKFKWTIFI